MIKTIRAADLFAGAGGASNGLARAAGKLGRRLDLVAVNHWPTAVETHTANHPAARHLCEDLESVNPRKAVPGGKLDVLLAGPECTHHSTARGGKPVNDQSRASAWCILRWATALTIDTILIENVREFLTWGPIGANGRPLKSRRGETFQAFVEALKSLGYRVDWRILNAANYGDPTTRERLFVQARRGRRPIVWPEPSHSSAGDSSSDLFGKRKPWRPARDIIDWAIPGQSIFQRKRPLSANTLARIAAGLKKFGGKAAEPFLVLLRGTASSQVPYTARSVDRPCPTVAANGNHIGLCEPFILPQFGESTPRSVNKPLGTITTTSRGVGLVEPFIVPTNYGERPGQSPRCHSLGAPMPTVVGTVAHGLVEPFIISMEHSGANGKQVRSVNQPLPTITSRGDLRVIEPFVLGQQSGSVPRSTKQPLPTVATDGAIGLVEPFVIPTNHGATNGGGKRAYPIDRPMPTITTVDAWGLIEPFLTRYNNNRPDVAARDLKEPLPAVDCNDRYGLVTVDGMALDIRFRMLQPHELAAAHSFPPDYQFSGNREQRVKQIGNSWPNALSEALCLALLEAS